MYVIGIYIAVAKPEESASAVVSRYFCLDSSHSPCQPIQHTR